MNQETQQKINELREIIRESREWGHNKVADMFAEELETLLANNKLVGKFTNQELKERIDISGGDFD